MKLILGLIFAGLLADAMLAQALGEYINSQLATVQAALSMVR